MSDVKSSATGVTQNEFNARYAQIDYRVSLQALKRSINKDKHPKWLNAVVKDPRSWATMKDPPKTGSWTIDHQKAAKAIYNLYEICKVFSEKLAYLQKQTGIVENKIPHVGIEQYLQTDFSNDAFDIRCASHYTTFKTWRDAVKAADDKEIKDRTDDEKRILVEAKTYNGYVYIDPLTSDSQLIRIMGSEGLNNPKYGPTYHQVTEYSQFDQDPTKGSSQKHAFANDASTLQAILQNPATQVGDVLWDNFIRTDSRVIKPESGDNDEDEDEEEKKDEDEEEKKDEDEEEKKNEDEKKDEDGDDSPSINVVTTSARMEKKVQKSTVDAMRKAAVITPKTVTTTTPSSKKVTSTTLSSKKVASTTPSSKKVASAKKVVSMPPALSTKKVVSAKKIVAHTRPLVADDKLNAKKKTTYTAAKSSKSAASSVAVAKKQNYDSSRDKVVDAGVQKAPTHSSRVAMQVMRTFSSLTCSDCSSLFRK